MRTFDEKTTKIVLRIRARLKKEGWDNGPKSIWFTGVDADEFGQTIPSVATIARILSSSGVTNANPRKRPRAAWLRFARSAAMEMWQLDAFENRLATVLAPKVTVYQLLDDSTRLPLSTCRSFSRAPEQTPPFWARACWPSTTRSRRAGSRPWSRRSPRDASARDLRSRPQLPCPGSRGICASARGWAVVVKLSETAGGC